MTDIGWTKAEYDAAGAELVGRLHARIQDLEDERQMVLDCINLYGDETLHSALDAIGWP